MAKGNLMLGTARNSVGDVVMYRREGAQISRVRVRNVKNPKTDAQSFQRAIMAPIAKFYSPLAIVLERSFEGLSKAKSHNKFNQVNANLARANQWALPKGTGFFPLPYQLSQGTLARVNSEFDLGLKINVPGLADDGDTLGALSTALIENGFKEGDVVTIIAITTNNPSVMADTYVPYSYQFAIDPDSTEVIADFFGSNVQYNHDADFIKLDTINGDDVEAGAVIVSRFDGTMWRRSTQFLTVSPSLVTAVTDNAAVAAAIASYGATAADANPLVYLDGDDLQDGE